MCLIVTQSRSDNPTDLTFDEVQDAFDQNGDGSGIMFDEDGKLVTWKAFHKVTDLWDAYKEALERYTTHLAVHWRWSTSGSNTERNTHPHPICHGKVALMHNGILPADQTPFDISDTVYWARTVFYGRSVNHVMGQRFRNHIEQYIGGDKIVLMDHAGRLSILNESEGTWMSGRWHSNDCLWQYGCYSARPGTRVVDYSRPEDHDWKRGFSTAVTGCTYASTKGRESDSAANEDWIASADLGSREEATDRYQGPFSSLCNPEWLARHFDEHGVLVDPHGDYVLDRDGTMLVASDFVMLADKDDDGDIHEYFGLLTGREAFKIQETVAGYATITK